ncbi:MAG: ornithine carbamoyltransferase [Acidobacteria bacterium]|nr:ornithine carbamoyltransferase [Acidobacteriota bacterium]
MRRHFVAVAETTHDEFERILELARQPVPSNDLAGTRVSLVFERPSLRTRASSVAAVQDLGGNYSMFTDAEIGLDTREAAEDVARTLAQTSTIVAARVRDHQVFSRMRSATGDAVSYINLLSDQTHPTQATADVLTLADHFSDGDPLGLAGRTVTYVGDATNVTRSLATALIGFGVTVRIVAPVGYDLSSDQCAVIEARARYGGQLQCFTDPTAAVPGSDALYTDSWISMGLEHEAEERRRVFRGFQIDESLFDLAPTSVFLHCLPAHRGEEVSHDVMESPRSLVWQQVRHRTTAMYGVLRWLEEK